VRSHIDPFLGDRTVESIGNVALRDFVEHLSTQNLAPKTINDILGVAKAVISSCLDPDTGEALYSTKFNHEFIDVPVVEEKKQRRPIVSAEELESALIMASGFDRAMLALAAGSGVRIGELLALRVSPSDLSSSWNRDEARLTIKTSMFEGQEQSPKTKHSPRTIELAEPLNNLLKVFAGSRMDGFLFGNGNPTSISTMRDHLDKYLPSRGFHSLRRFRSTTLRKARCHEEITKFWLGHRPVSSVTDLYSRVADDEKFRREECLRIGLGFSLPRS
jgi:integrase